MHSLSSCSSRSSLIWFVKSINEHQRIKIGRKVKPLIKRVTPMRRHRQAVKLQPMVDITPATPMEINMAVVYSYEISFIYKDVLLFVFLLFLSLMAIIRVSHLSLHVLLGFHPIFTCIHTYIYIFPWLYLCLSLLICLLSLVKTEVSFRSDLWSESDKCTRE